MLPEVKNDIFLENKNFDEIALPSKTYNIETDANILDDALTNITFKIVDLNLIEIIDELPALVQFTIENGYLIVSTE